MKLSLISISIYVSIYMHVCVYLSISIILHYHIEKIPDQ